MRIVVLGPDLAGARACRQLVASASVTEVVLAGRDLPKIEALAGQMGDRVAAMPWDAGAREEADVVVLDAPDDQPGLARAALGRGAHVVSLATDLATVRDMLALEETARGRGRHVAIGASFAPGLSCVLARHGAADLDRVEEVHVAKLEDHASPRPAGEWWVRPTGGPEWREGRWAVAGARTGPQRCWFPPPVGERECRGGPYPDPLLLVPAFAGVQRVTCRGAGAVSGLGGRWRWRRSVRTRPDDQPISALRVELRGWIGPSVAMRRLGAVDRPAVAGGAVSALAAIWAASGRLARPGAAGLAELVDDTAGFLRDLAARGVRAAVPEDEGGPRVPPGTTH